ncbi:MAG: hypothetical protein R3F56_19920 [Planctomycetota bacterium]
MQHRTLALAARPAPETVPARGRAAHRSTRLACLLAAALSGTISSQNYLQINEIDFDNQVIEVANFDSADLDLSAWSIYQATETAGRAGAYWWGFPAGTMLPRGSFLRIRWLNPIEVGNTNPLLLDTGDTSYHFLFFLRGEPLDPAGGALGLVATRNANEVNTASYYRDFVAWGSSTGLFPREDLAAQNGRWYYYARVLSPYTGQSIALDSRNLAEPTAPNQWFRDESPTLGMANHAGENAVAYGDGCVIGLGAPSQLAVESIPVDGNLDFRLIVDNLAPNTALAVFFGLPVAAGIPWVTPCRIWFDIAGPYMSLATGTTTDTFVYRPPVEALPYGALGIQVVGLRPNGSLVLTNGARVNK